MDGACLTSRFVTLYLLLLRAGSLDAFSRLPACRCVQPRGRRVSHLDPAGAAPVSLCDISPCLAAPPLCLCHFPFCLLPQRVTAQSLLHPWASLHKFLGTPSPACIPLSLLTVLPAQCGTTCCYIAILAPLSPQVGFNIELLLLN